MGVLTGKTAIVTGAARGIGRQVALTLATEGAEVIALDLEREAGEAVERELGRLTTRAKFIEVDLTNFEQMTDVIAGVRRDFGRIDILVNNAGVTRQIGFFDVTPADIDWILSINLKGALLVMQAVARVMKECGGGRIVNMASIAGKGFRNTSNIAYAASKGAVITMTRVAAVQLGEFNITVNSVCPGLTETEMMLDWIARRAKERGVSEEAQREELVKDIPLRRVNSTNDIAAAVLYLVSPQSRNVTGQSLNVDGGLIWD